MVLLAALGCGGAVGLSTAEAPDVTWHRDVRAIVDQRCLGCHVAGGVAPLDLSDPAVVEANGPAIAADVAARKMPPWGFDADCREPIGSMWLTDAEVAAFDGWSRNAFAVGDPADYVAPAPPIPFDPGLPDEVLTPSEPYTPRTDRPDDYRCLTIDAPTARELYLTGVRTTPQNLAVAHHVLLYAVAPAERPALDALSAVDPEPGYECFGGPGVDSAITIGGWAPGNLGQFVPDGTAIRIPAGSTLVLQMHYNTSALVGDPGTDQTPVELWEMPEGVVPDEVVIAYPVVKLGLNVPAGASDHEQVARMRIPVDGQILSSAPHMHTHGTALRTDLYRSNGDQVCVSDMPRWDFNWQRNYGVPDGQWIPVTVDDEVEISCTYDNPGATDLWWGEGTADEMCLDYVGIVVPWDGGTTGGTCSGYPTCDAGCAADDPFCSLGCMTTSGDACLFAGLESVFGTCVGTQCALSGLALQGCMASCAPEFEDTFGCLYDECSASFDQYWACVKPVLEAGAPGCEQDFAAVPELLGAP